MEKIFYRPNEAYVGDVIPFSKDGYAYLYFLYEDRKVPKTGMPWHLVRTKDYVTFEKIGEKLPSGGKSKDDFNCYTGSIVTDEKGVIHLFYTGNNPRTKDETGGSLQLVMHATSTDDMKTWIKHEELTFGPNDNYEIYDWRDPFVIYDEEKKIWRMLLAARKKVGPERRRGVTAQCISTDLESWEITSPFWDPDKFVAMECPEVFKWGDWWYFVYSEFSDGFTTQYRMAKHLDGPWTSPKHNNLEGRAFYASKSLFLDNRRYFTGWISTKEADSDDGAWQWAGTMSTLEAKQNIDGTLSFCLPSEVISNIKNKALKDLNVQLKREDGYQSYMLSEKTNESTSYSKFIVDVSPDTKDWGVLLRASEDGDQSYVVRVEMNNNRLIFDRWPRKQLGSEQWQISGDVPYYVELERSIDLSSGQHTLEILQEGTIGVIVLDHKVTMSVRMYDKLEGKLGLFVDDGEVNFMSLERRG
ncbi:glycoside hydrolase [Dellaglioa sp. BT-FLS60]